jgi:TolB protein
MELFWAGGRPPATGIGTLRGWELRFPEALAPFGVDQAQLNNEASSPVPRSTNQTTYRPMVTVRDAADVLPWHPDRTVSGGPSALVYITTEQWSPLHEYRVTVSSVDTLDEVLDTGWVTVTRSTWYALPAPSGTGRLWHGLERGQYRWSVQARFPDIRQDTPDRWYHGEPVTGTFRILDQRNLWDRIAWFMSSLIRGAHAAPPTGETHLSPPPTLPSPEEMGLEYGEGELAELPPTPQPELTPTPVVSLEPTLAPVTAGFTELLVSLERDGQQDIALVSVADGAITWLTDDPGYDGLPAWSLDGQEIVFFSRRDNDPTGLMGIYLMSRDGGNQRLLPDSEGASEHVGPVWSPDGTRIGYVLPAALEGTGDTVCIHPVAGGTFMCYEPEGLVRGDLTWSPDGTRLAALGLFGDDPMIIDRTREIIIVLDTSDSRGSPWLTRLVLPGGPLCPSWSPADDRIAYTAYTPPGWSVFTARSDGTDVREVGRVPEATMCESMRAWSPDGAWIAYNLSEGIYEHSGLAIGTADGLQHRTLLDATDWVRDIVWSADGTEIAYVWLESWETSGAVGREGTQRLEIIRLEDLSRKVVLDTMVGSIAPPPLQR